MIIDLPWQGRDVPCAILDIIRGCNARCAFCYNQDHAAVKPFEEVEGEIRTLIGFRNLQALMVSGGEPLLHPDVLRILRAIKSHGLMTILLTNGILLDERMAADLKAAGCDLCYLHVQTGQRRADLPDPEDRTAAVGLLRRKAKTLVAAGIRAGCCVTLRADDREGIAREAKTYFETPELTNILFTTARAPEDFERPAFPDMPIDDLLARFAALGLPPFATLSGKIDPSCRRWFSFQAIEARRPDGRVTARIGLRASFGERTAMGLLRLMKGHYDFTLPPASSALLRLRLVLNALTGGEFLRPMKMAFSTGVRLVHRNLALDIPPYRRPDGRIEYCSDCPGAILKNGKLRPLCLSDIDVVSEELR
jgi:hypothetical protein